MGRRRPPALVGGLAVSQTVAWGVLYYAFSVLLVPMQRDLGWSRGVLVGGFTTAVVVSGLAAPAVGRLLDAGRERVVMAGGAAAGAALVAAWSQVRAPVPYYAVWIGMGLAMASVLYEPAFTVLAKRRAPHHRRPITIVTLVAGLASTIFQPLASTLSEALGWRPALLVLAAVVLVVVVPVHVAVLGGRPAPAPFRRPTRGAAARRPRPPEADRRFWALTAAFAAVAATSFATGVLLVAHLVDHGWALGRAAVAGGTLGAMQLPGRLAFGPAARRLPPAALAAGTFTLPAAGVLLLVVADGGALVWPAVVVLGVGQGATTLLRATAFVDLYGTERIGALNGLAGSRITVVRAVAPLLAALAAPRVGFAATFVALAAVALGAAVVASRVLGGIDRPGDGRAPAGATTR
jgi:hypothetical protein